jgi:hypothetical protein
MFLRRTLLRGERRRDLLGSSGGLSKPKKTVSQKKKKLVAVVRFEMGTSRKRN